MARPIIFDVHGQSSALEICKHLYTAYLVKESLAFKTDFLGTCFCNDCFTKCGFDQVLHYDNVERWMKTAPDNEERLKNAHDQMMKELVCTKCLEAVFGKITSQGLF